MESYWNDFLNMKSNELRYWSLEELLRRYHEWLLLKSKAGEVIFPIPDPQPVTKESK